MIRYDPKSVQIIDFSVKRIQSTKCEHWLPLSQGRSIAKKKKRGRPLKFFAMNVCSYDVICRRVYSDCPVSLPKIKCNISISISRLTNFTQ